MVDGVEWWIGIVDWNGMEQKLGNSLSGHLLIKSTF